VAFEIQNDSGAAGGLDAAGIAAGAVSAGPDAITQMSPDAIWLTDVTIRLSILRACRRLRSSAAAHFADGAEATGSAGSTTIAIDKPAASAGSVVPSVAAIPAAPAVFRNARRWIIGNMIPLLRSGEIPAVIPTGVPASPAVKAGVLSMVKRLEAYPVASARSVCSAFGSASSSE